MVYFDVFIIYFNVFQCILDVLIVYLNIHIYIVLIDILIVYLNVCKCNHSVFKYI
jgi:hypothetical protein